MRLQMHKMSADDFEPLTMIGKGAFREVLFLFPIQCEIPLRNVVIVPITFTAKISLLKLRLQIICSLFKFFAALLCISFSLSRRGEGKCSMR
jgi:hypothetical protein